MNNSICTLFDNILIDIHKFKSLHKFPTAKPYVSGMKNVRFRCGKHKKYKGITALLPNHFSIPPYPFFQSSPEKPE